MSVPLHYKNRVTLEPELEFECALMTAPARRKLARKLYRWAKQLWISADMLDLDETKPRPKLKKLSARKLTLN